jgi:hypothetical protein
MKTSFCLRKDDLLFIPVIDEDSFLFALSGVMHINNGYLFKLNIITLLPESLNIF